MPTKSLRKDWGDAVFKFQTGRPSRAGSKSAYDKQVSQKGRQLLLWLLKAQRAMTSEADQEVLRNQGIPWKPAEAAAALQVLASSVPRTLSGLEERRLVFCWASGRGRGRRVSHIKLTWAAEKLAEDEERWGMSAAQLGRLHARQWRERCESRELAYAEYAEYSDSPYHSLPDEQKNLIPTESGSPQQDT